MLGEEQETSGSGVTTATAFGGSLICSLFSWGFFFMYFFGIKENREGLGIGRIEGIRTKIRSEKSSRYEE